ncbi:MAG: NADPH-dependent 7-cyano-7-deazaguanine reductase QueF [Deltaproteobacteria bacterium]|nr:NADPH-dependent 7-cyano-7-deazaguanine reductase QueF [Deltaproteobacteria bacterium]
MKDSFLGKQVKQPEHYDPTLLCTERRPSPGVMIHGFDLWRAYELSWIGSKGKPGIAILEMSYPRSTQSIIESKSFKLYLNSLAKETFNSATDVVSLIKKDITDILDAEWISLKLYDAGQPLPGQWETVVRGTCIDTLDVSVDKYERDPTLLIGGGETKEEMLYSHLLRTMCPVTGQPDWASIVVHYIGPAIDHASLLRYIISYREYRGFSETCCDLIYKDILEICNPKYLMVSLRYTRRGGIDINPVRASQEILPDELPDWRLSRQ